MTMPLISVVMAVYNCEAFITKSLDSIINQTYSNLEILVCDDCSTDNTWNILKTYRDNRIKVFKNDKNHGVVYTRNLLFQRTNGQYIVIQDGDDWSETNRIETMLRVFQEDVTLSACGIACIRVDCNDNYVRHKDRNSYYLKLDDCLALPFMPATLMIRQEVYQEIGGYHNYFSRLFAEDLYWVMRIVEKYKVLYLNSPLYYYRFNPDSITNTVNKEAFIVEDLIRVLLSQRKSTGLDWIEQNDEESIKRFKNDRFADRKWLSEKYRMAAAIQRDGKKSGVAIRMIFRAIFYNPLSFKNYVTLRYVFF